MSIRRNLSVRWTRVAALLMGGWVVLRLTLPDPLVPAEFSTTVRDRQGRLLGARSGRDGQWRFPEGDSVPHRFRICLLQAEDRRFRWHLGVDPVAVVRALGANSRKATRRQGASTLTMQLARLSRRARGADPTRTWAAKVAETWLALRIELTQSKETVLRQWCAHAPFGGNVVGLEAASWRWYGKSASQLSWGEAATLAAIPNSPSRVGARGDTAALRARRDWILAGLRARGVLDPVEEDLARSEGLPGRPRALPRQAPHLVELLRSRGEGRNWATEIDGDLQAQATALAREHVQELRRQGITGMAVVVAELAEGTPPVVRAWVGGVVDPTGDADPGSHVDLALAPRSTGSTLKPFLYGQLLDQGLLLPSQWIQDLPTRFGDFRPANASGEFEGIVPADQALARSLNVPWVRELRRMGVEPFRDQLIRAGMAHLFRPAEDYGLALALGAGEASLSELVAMYAALGNQGVAQPMELARTGSRRLRIGGPPAAGGQAANLETAHRAYLAAMEASPKAERILSPGASWLTLQALRIGGRIEEEAAWRAFASGRPVAWKTGTSFGHRDAWALGVTPRWVVGVWVGNPQGDGRPHLWGSQAAAPFLFRLLPILPLDERAWWERPDDLVAVRACSTSGMRASPWCHTKQVWAPPAGRGAPMDSFHQVVRLDSSRSWRVDASCHPPDRQVVDTLVVLPPGAGSYYHQVHPGRIPPLPPFAPGCGEGERSPSMEILLPEEGSTLTLPLDLDGTLESAVAEVRHQDRNAAVRCFLDGRDLGLQTRFGAFSMRPEPGPHLLTCTDDKGETENRRFRVERSRKTSTGPLPSGRKMGTMVDQ